MSYLDETRNLIQTGFGGGRAMPARKPDKPKKKLTWVNDFEINPQAPQVNVIMDAVKWAEQIPYTSNKQPEAADCKPISFEVDGETLTVDVSLYSDSVNAVVFNIVFKNLALGIFSETRDFEDAFMQRANKELDTLGTDHFLTE